MLGRRFAWSVIHTLAGCVAVCVLVQMGVDGSPVTAQEVVTVQEAESAALSPTLSPVRTSKERAAVLTSTPWIEIIEREIPPLTHSQGDRLPMIMWHGVGFQPLSPAQHRVLRERGLTQHLQMDAAMIPAALSLQEAGMPVILMQGRTDNWPYSLAENSDDWAHQFDVTYQPPWFGKDDGFEWHGACPHKTDGWRILEQQTRATMKQFRDAGVQIAGVWMDFEGDPYPWNHLFDQLKHCKRCRAELPPEVLNDQDAWRDASWRRYIELYDAHFAKPIREIYPTCLVTNWHVVASTAERPVRYFTRDVKLPVLNPLYFNATNPIAYGSDVVWHNLHSTEAEQTQAAVDDFFASEILQQVTTDHLNRQTSDRKLTSVPWVARYCRIDISGRKHPLMTRQRYRETLSQIWQRDIATMQVFNAMHEGYEEYALNELQDAVQAYDASLK